MAAFKLLTKLVVYYAILAAVFAALLWAFPDWREYIPIGRAEILIAQAGGDQLPTRGAGTQLAHMASLGPSVVWMTSAVVGALMAALPVSWVYMEIRNPSDYDQSLVDTIVMLPLVVTAIVVVVQHSLALSFSLAGIAGAARYRNSLKSSGDLLFILLAIGIGLSAGIGALEIAMVTSAVFNLCFIALWSTSYGERAKMKRFLGGYEHPGHAHAGAAVVTSTVLAAEVTETVETRQDDDD